MTKNELKNGAIVKLKNGQYYFKMDDTLLQIYIIDSENVDLDCSDLFYNNFHIFLTYDFMPLDKYKNDLTYLGDDEWSIIAVYNDVKNANGYSNQAVANVIRKGYKSIDEYKIHFLTKQEEEVIKSIDSSIWKYIARDKDGNLFLYRYEPKKDDYIWYIDHADDTNDTSEFRAFNHMFKFIFWDDSKPYNIKSLQKQKQG